MIIKRRTLKSFHKNVYSQNGEDGVIHKIFSVVKPSKWCVEFGAWDGIHLSNTYHLIKDRGWSGILIESDFNKFSKLVANLSGTKAVGINTLVKASGMDSLDNILLKTSTPVNFDLLSIDIDGNDYHIWRGLNKYKPKLVVIEFNPTIPIEVKFVQPYNPKLNQGSSLSSLIELAESKGYKLIETTDTNAFFIQNKYFSLFKFTDNSPDNIWVERYKYITYLFQLYDGTIMTRGNKMLLWHGIEINNNRIQIIPKFLRHLPVSKTDYLILKMLKGWQQISNSVRKNITS